MLCITNNSIKHQLFVFIHLKDQTVLLQTIRFSISHLFTLYLNVKLYWNLTISPIDKTLSGATTPGQSVWGSDGNERVLCFSRAGYLPLDGSVSYPGHSLGGGVFILCRDAEAIESTASAAWDEFVWFLCLMVYQSSYVI